MFEYKKILIILKIFVLLYYCTNLIIPCGCCGSCRKPSVPNSNFAGDTKKKGCNGIDFFKNLTNISNNSILKKEMNTEKENGSVGLTNEKNVDLHLKETDSPLEKTNSLSKETNFSLGVSHTVINENIEKTFYSTNDNTYNKNINEINSNSEDFIYNVKECNIIKQKNEINNIYNSKINNGFQTSENENINEVRNNNRESIKKENIKENVDNINKNKYKRNKDLLENNDDSDGNSSEIDDKNYNNYDVYNSNIKSKNNSVNVNTKNCIKEKTDIYVYQKKVICNKKEKLLKNKFKDLSTLNSCDNKYSNKDIIGQYGLNSDKNSDEDVIKNKEANIIYDNKNYVNIKHNTYCKTIANDSVNRRKVIVDFDNKNIKRQLIFNDKINDLKFLPVEKRDIKKNIINKIQSEYNSIFEKKKNEYLDSENEKYSLKNLKNYKISSKNVYKKPSIIKKPSILFNNGLKSNTTCYTNIFRDLNIERNFHTSNVFKKCNKFFPSQYQKKNIREKTRFPNDIYKNNIVKTLQNNSINRTRIFDKLNIKKKRSCINLKFSKNSSCRHLSGINKILNNNVVLNLGNSRKRNFLNYRTTIQHCNLKRNFSNYKEGFHRMFSHLCSKGNSKFSKNNKIKNPLIINESNYINKSKTVMFNYIIEAIRKFKKLSDYDSYDRNIRKKFLDDFLHCDNDIKKSIGYNSFRISRNGKDVNYCLQYKDDPKESYIDKRKKIINMFNKKKNNTHKYKNFNKTVVYNNTTKKSNNDIFQDRKKHIQKEIYITKKDSQTHVNKFIYNSNINKSGNQMEYEDGLWIFPRSEIKGNFLYLPCTNCNCNKFLFGSKIEETKNLRSRDTDNKPIEIIKEEDDEKDENKVYENNSNMK